MGASYRDPKTILRRVPWKGIKSATKAFKGIEKKRPRPKGAEVHFSSALWLCVSFSFIFSMVYPTPQNKPLFQPVYPFRRLDAQKTLLIIILKCAFFVCVHPPFCEGKLKCWVGACALFVKKKEKPPRSTNQKNTKSNAIGFVCATPPISNLWYYFFKQNNIIRKNRNKNLTPFLFYNIPKENNVLWMVSIIFLFYKS
jgi:hypothetical protein